MALARGFGAPKGLRSGGVDLYRSLMGGSSDHARRALAIEAARLRDRCDRYEQLLGEMDPVAGDALRVAAQARQCASALRLLVGQLSGDRRAVGSAEEGGADSPGGIDDELADARRRRTARSAATPD